jgi:hypothetical protein
VLDLRSGAVVALGALDFVVLPEGFADEFYAAGEALLCRAPATEAAGTGPRPRRRPLADPETLREAERAIPALEPWAGRRPEQEGAA